MVSGPLPKALGSHSFQEVSVTREVAGPLYPRAVPRGACDQLGPGDPKMEKRKEKLRTHPSVGNRGREAPQGVGGEEASSLPHPTDPEAKAALRG